MIDTKLLDLINGGNAWLFIGSGLSIEAGLPSWPNLVSLTLDRLSPAMKDALSRDRRFRKAQESQDFPACFQRMQSLAGPSVVRDEVREIILKLTNEPGDLMKLLTDWPAAGYLTTNYDDLIEIALKTNGVSGWLSIGNQPAEIRKVSGDVNDIVWHIHGSARMSETLSKLVIGSKDYDDLYLENSVLQQQLKSFLTQRRFVFVGFGLRDPEIMRLLKLVGRYTVPERPIYAFLGSRGLDEDEELIEDLRDQYNLEIKLYRIVDNDHRDLRELLQMYNSMIVRRSVNYGQRRTVAPSYDPDATGLLIYNTLVLQAPTALEDKTLRTLLSARILSVTEHKELVSLEELSSDVGRIAPKLANNSNLSTEIASVLSELEKDNLIESKTNVQGRVIQLTTDGRTFVSQRAGVADRIRQQFRESLAARAGALLLDHQSTEEVMMTTASFFEDCIEKRSLGVAMALNAASTVAQEFQMVALLQSLPKYFERLANPESAKSLVKVIQGVLSGPTPAEAKYYGLLLQARFGVHLLGVDQNTIISRIKALKDMVFVLDSTSLIPLIAVSGTGHQAAVELLNRIARVGAKAITTNNLLIEVSEHADYATRTVRDEGGPISAGVLNNLIGRKGQSRNVFLSGFVEECASGVLSGNDFSQYMRVSCGFNPRFGTIDNCNILIRKYDVQEVSLQEITGFVEEDNVEIEELKIRIEERRLQAKNFRHERQVRAEAEVAVLVQRLREKVYEIEQRRCDGAFFVSNSRFIDELYPSGLPVTIRQNVLLQWLGTVAPFEESELHVLMDGLLWELSERGYEFVNKKTLTTAFSGMVSASREEYEKIVDEHKTLIAMEWGVDAEDAFREPIDDLDISTLVSQHALQTIDRQRRELERVKASVLKSGTEGELSDSERAQFERLKSKKAMRVDRNRRRALRNKAMGGKRRRRKKPKR